MCDIEQIERNLAVKQQTFFAAARKEGFSIPILTTKLNLRHRSTLDSYVDKPSRKASLMPLAMFIALAKVVPTHLASLLIDDSGHDLVRHEPERASWLELGANMSAFASKVLTFQATGNHIDHVEGEILREDVITIISQGQAAVAGS